MSERLTPPQPEARMVLDTIHEYRGYHTDGAVCRIRIYDRGQESPVVIASELPENKNTSITNMAEYLAWEVGNRYLGGRFEHDEPFTWIEHYPGQPDGIRELRHDRYSRVSFADYKPHVQWMGGVKRVKVGKPEWTHMSREEVEQLVGRLPDTVSGS